MNFPLRPLGRSGCRISPIGLGCWQFSKKNNFAGRFWPRLEDEVILSIVKRSLEGGINWFDTAELYGDGASEKSLSSALLGLNKKPVDVTIATKWWPMFRRAGSITRTIGKRLEALSPFPIDLYQVHQPYGFSSVPKEMEAMISLVRDNRIRYVGVSNFNEAQMRRAWETLDKAGIPLVSNQVRYSLLDRKIESNGVLKAARELGITVIAYSPLAQGLLSGKFHDRPELIKNAGFRRYRAPFKAAGIGRSRQVIGLLKELAAKYNVTTSQVALNWLIHFHGDTVVAIPGATREQHASENTGAMDFRLSAEDMSALDKISEGFK